jgi:hypothetical protein
VKQVLPVETNIVIFEVEDSAKTGETLAAKGIRTSPFSPTFSAHGHHLDITDEMMTQLEKLLV